jgi:hypothetical protein
MKKKIDDMLQLAIAVGIVYGVYWVAEQLVGEMLR